MVEDICGFADLQLTAEIPLIIYLATAHLLLGHGNKVGVAVKN